MDEHLAMCLGAKLSLEELAALPLVPGARQLVYTWKARSETASILFAPADAQGVMRAELTDRALAFFHGVHEHVYCTVGWLHQGEYSIFSSMDVRYTTSVVKETLDGELEIMVPDYIKTNYVNTLYTCNGGRKIELQMPAADMRYVVVDAQRGQVWLFTSVDRIAEFVLHYSHPTGLSVFSCIGDNSQGVLVMRSMDQSSPECEAPPEVLDSAVARISRLVFEMHHTAGADGKHFERLDALRNAYYPL